MKSNGFYVSKIFIKIVLLLCLFISIVIWCGCSTLSRNKSLTNNKIKKSNEELKDPELENKDVLTPELDEKKIIEQLYKTNDITELWEVLSDLNNRGIIAYGKRDNFVITKDSKIYILVCDENNIETILKFPSDSLNISDAEGELKKMLQPFEGKYQIWIQYLE